MVICMLGVNLSLVIVDVAGWQRAEVRCKSLLVLKKTLYFGCRSWNLHGPVGNLSCFYLLKLWFIHVNLLCHFSI